MTPTEKKLFAETIQKANAILVDQPTSVYIDLVKTDYGTAFGWVDISTAAKKARKELRVILNEMWQAGAFNYEQIARGMRVDETAIQGLMDEEFIAKYGL